MAVSGGSESSGPALSSILSKGGPGKSQHKSWGAKAANVVGFTQFATASHASGMFKISIRYNPFKRRNFSYHRLHLHLTFFYHRRCLYLDHTFACFVAYLVVSIKIDSTGQIVSPRKIQSHKPHIYNNIDVCF